jgi:hypothetical protein
VSIETYLLYLGNKGLIDCNPSKVFERVRKLPFAKLVDILLQSEDLIPLPEPKAYSQYDFFANESMAGGRNPCAEPACRFRRLHETVAFAALYADCVWIPSPLGRIIERADIESVRQEVLLGVVFLEHIRPLLEAGIVKLAPRHSSHYCSDCYAAAVRMSPKTYARRFEQCKKLLEQALSEQVKYKVSKHKGVYTVIPADNALSDFLGDDHYAYYYTPPKKEDNWAGISLNKTLRTITSAEAKKMGIVDRYADGILFDVFHQNLFAARYGAGYLTSRPIDLTLINHISPTGSKAANKSLTRSLSHDVPIGIDMQLPEVLRLRDAERGHFLRYRDAVSQAIAEARTTSAKDTKAVFFDLVAPELNRLNVVVSEARKASKNNLIKDMLAPSAFLGIGMFSGLVSPTIAAVASAVGGLHFIDKLAGHAKDLLTDPKEATQDKMYWLWKVNK